MIILLISWLVVGFIAGIIKINDKDFNEIHKNSLKYAGLSEPPNPKLFTLASSTLFGYYAMYVQIKWIIFKNN